MKIFTRSQFESWGSVGGRKSRRTLTTEQSKAMLAIREMNRANKKSISEK